MTRDGNGGPMRTEDDLRQALATLERHAPSADTVLAAVRGAAGGGTRLGRPQPDPPVRGHRQHTMVAPASAVLALAAAAAAAGLVITLLPGSTSPRPGSRPARPRCPAAPQRGRLPSAASVGRAMLTAFNGVTGDIEYTTQTGVNKGVTVDVYRTWSWPAAPAPGQCRSSARCSPSARRRYRP